MSFMRFKLLKSRINIIFQDGTKILIFCTTMLLSFFFLSLHLKKGEREKVKGQYYRTRGGIFYSNIFKDAGMKTVK